MQSAHESDLNPHPHAVLHPAPAPDHNQQQQQPPQPQQSPPVVPGPSRKRKKADTPADKVEPEPRRLRRSHEACARCRSKKIKCDSQHPRCGACAQAGVICNQEDRHRQTLTPRGHTEKLERQLAQCEALLKKHIEGFDLADLDAILVREGIDIDSRLPAPFPMNQRPFPLGENESPTNASSVFPSPGAPPPGYIYPPFHNGHSTTPHMAVPSSNGVIRRQPAGNPYPPYAPPPPPLSQYSVRTASGPQERVSAESVRGQDPQSMDMSTTQSLAKNFGVSAALTSDLKLGEGTLDKEDLAVGSLSSGRDNDLKGEMTPRSPALWIFRSMRRGSTVAGKVNTPVMFWLPRDRAMTNQIVDIYFVRLNYHRPVFIRSEFQASLDALYDASSQTHDDPGFLCSLYLVLALGTLSQLNHTFHEGSSAKQLSPEWPEHDEFFERALGVKPELRVTVSSLQALILLQWYLYTERHGRTLWRLVGNLVRLSVELGLHHDPLEQGSTFTPSECQLRMRLWWIVMVHDRGTSLLLGRPLAIAAADFNTPEATRSSPQDFSEHFQHSRYLTDVQGDIINSLYRPAKQTSDAIVRHAYRIIKSMVEFRNQLPESYRPYFAGTENWPEEERTKLAVNITEDQGLTLLKYGIARMLLLRALFSAKELSFAQRHRALEDAVITSHNVIIIHAQLIHFPDIAFFVSPIPLHIAAMVILYGYISNCKRLDKQTSAEDVWLALGLIPHFRWRWERKDCHGGHPLIFRLAKRVFPDDMHRVGPATRPILIPEMDWDEEDAKSSSIAVQSPSSAAQTNSSVATPAPSYATPSNGSYGHNHTHSQPPPQAHQSAFSMPDCPPALFFPLVPENPANFEPPWQQNAPQSEISHMSHPAEPEDLGQILSQLPVSIGTVGCQPSHDLFVQEELDPSAADMSGHYISPDSKVIDFFVSQFRSPFIPQQMQ